MYMYMHMYMCIDYPRSTQTLLPGRRASPLYTPYRPHCPSPPTPPHPTHTPLQVFPKLELKVSPKARAAITFNDCLPNGQEDPRTLHGGTPPTNGTKIAINIWIRAQSFSRGFM